MFNDVPCLVAPNSTVYKSTPRSRTLRARFSQLEAIIRFVITLYVTLLVHIAQDTQWPLAVARDKNAANATFSENKQNGEHKTLI